MAEKRSAKDDADFIKNLRREDTIKTEVIVQLRQQNQRLWLSQARLLKALIDAQDALRLYRVEYLAGAERAAESRSHCVPGCTDHEWRDADGWHRTNE